MQGKYKIETYLKRPLEFRSAKTTGTSRQEEKRRPFEIQKEEK